MAYHKVLVAVDFSDAAGQVMERAAQLAKEQGASIVLLHVVEYLPPMGFSGDPLVVPMIDIDESSLVERAEKSLQQFVDQHLAGVSLEQVVRIGIPKLEIINVLDELSIDLLLIGSHGRHGFARLLGSTAAAVLNDCPCDVLAVRIKE